MTGATGAALDGDNNGVPGGNHVVRGGLWTRIVYQDTDGDEVRLSLDSADTTDSTGRERRFPGLMELTRGATIAGRRLTLINSQPGAMLIGTIHLCPNGDGLTTLHRIDGADAVENKLPDSFVVQNLDAHVVDLLFSSNTNRDI